jgi:transposase
LTKISRPTINKILKKIRERIAKYCEEEAKFLGIVEVDESYFGPKRVRGKRGRGAGNKIKVFGLMKRKDKVYTQIVENCDRKTLQKIIKKHVDFKSEIHTDGWRSYNGLVDIGYKKHYRVYHGKNEFVRGKAHINGIENFWGIAKIRLSKFRGIHKSTFYLHLKECEFRFNFRKENIYDKILKMIRKSPLKLS